MLYFLCRMIINEQALVSSRPMPIITPVGINTLLFAKIIIQIWIFAGDSKRVHSIVIPDPLKRESEKISVEINCMKVGFRLHFKSLFFYEILQKAFLNTKQSKPYAKSEVKQFIGEKFNL